MQTANYGLVTTWQGGVSSRVLCQSCACKSHVIDTDEPVSLGGKGQVPAPPGNEQSLFITPKRLLCI
ncbi:hypothetical protein ACLBW0_06675 [Enterobacteriaceae bacterium C34A]